jgi:uncharacterized membrane protein (Fun14 family)
MPESDAPESLSAPANPVKSLTGWAKALIIVSVVLMAAGVAAPLVMGKPSSPAPGGIGIQSLGAGNPLGAQDAQGAPDFSPAIFRLGFSFFVAFTLAYALRAFFNIALIFIGMAFLLLFGLQYAGLIEVKWGVMEREYDGMSAWLQNQTKTFATFVTGYLPSAGAGAAGLVAGFRRRI